MDSLTQAVFGAAMGELILGKKLGWRAAACGAVIGTLPDLDVLVLPFLEPAAGMYWHRGLSHSILITIVVTLLFSWPLAYYFRERKVSVIEAGWVIFLGWGTHSMVDCFTTYGTQIYEPFSHERVEWNVQFIIDPLFTIPLIIGLWLAMRAPREGKKRTLMMGSAVIVSLSYVGFAFTMKGWATREIMSQMRNHHPDAELVQVATTPFNTILWRGLIETKDGYYTQYWSPFDSGEAHYDYIEKNREIMNPYEGTDVLDALKWFSRGRWVARKGDDGTLVFIDMRFPEIRDPKSNAMHPIFQWHMSRDDTGKISAPMLRPRELDFIGAMGKVWKRVWGDDSEWNHYNSF